MSYDKDAVLLWDVIENGETVTKKQNVFISEESVTRQEFYVSQQSGFNVQNVFKMNSIDFDLSKHLETDTMRPLYASQIIVDGAKYDIVRIYRKTDEEFIELICS